MGMATIQELYGNLEEYKVELKRCKRNDHKKKRTLALKASNSFDDKDDELDEFETKDEEDKMALLGNKLQRILREKRNKENRKTLPQKKNLNRNDQ